MHDIRPTPRRPQGVLWHPCTFLAPLSKKLRAGTRKGEDAADLGSERRSATWMFWRLDPENSGDLPGCNESSSPQNLEMENSGTLCDVSCPEIAKYALYGLSGQHGNAPLQGQRA